MQPSKFKDLVYHDLGLGPHVLAPVTRRQQSVNFGSSYWLQCRGGAFDGAPTDIRTALALSLVLRPFVFAAPPDAAPRIGVTCAAGKFAS
jgi:hypothetical protein